MKRLIDSGDISRKLDSQEMRLPSVITFTETSSSKTQNHCEFVSAKSILAITTIFKMVRKQL